MRTHSLNLSSVNSGSAIPHPGANPASTDGLISELVYSEDQCNIAQCLLLPLLQQLCHQSRWQLWLTPHQKLSRDWLRHSGLPLDKIMQVSRSGCITTVDSMIKALQTGNYSVVLGWFAEEISPSDRERLEQAAHSGRALGLIMRSEVSVFPLSKPLNGLRIQSSLYH